jgi:hypothetical protein
MRYLVVALFSCALAAPAFALPAAPIGLSDGKPVVQVARKSKAPVKRQSRGGNSSGGIHPLVGSGDY